MTVTSPVRPGVQLVSRECLEHGAEEPEPGGKQKGKEQELAKVLFVPGSNPLSPDNTVSLDVALLLCTSITGWVV